MRYIISIDMKTCYPASFQGEGKAKPFVKRFEHSTHCMTRVAINGTPQKTLALVKEDIHSIIPAWVGKHSEEQGSLPMSQIWSLDESESL